MSAKDVLIGREDFLFLSGGNHSPLSYSQGTIEVENKSIHNFWRNIYRRKNALEKRNILYRHVIAPDKHSVCRDVFPENISVFLGQKYISAASTSELASFVTYPLVEISADFRQYCYRTDTHYRPYGTSLILMKTLQSLDLYAPSLVLEKLIEPNLRYVNDWAGDLGSKFTPPKTEVRELLKHSPLVKRFSNVLAGGNNGILDLYINKSKDDLPLGRVMLFGDSYGRDIANQLAAISREVMFLRTPYCHIDLVDAAKPNIVITQNAERYLSRVLNDDARPMFFLFPFFKDQNYSMSVDCAKAVSAFFSVGREAGTKFLDDIYGV